MLEIASNPTCVYSAVPSRGSTQTVIWSRVAVARAGGQEMLEAVSLLELETIQSAGTPLRSCIAISWIAVTDICHGRHFNS